MEAGRGRGCVRGHELIHGCAAPHEAMPGALAGSLAPTSLLLLLLLKHCQVVVVLLQSLLLQLQLVLWVQRRVWRRVAARKALPVDTASTAIPLLPLG